MRTSIIALIILANIFCTKAQNLQWAYGFGNTGEDKGKTIAMDLWGNIYIAGAFNGTVDFNPGVGINNLAAIGTSSNAFILKLTSVGNFVWVKGFIGSGSEVKDIAIDNEGNVYTTGWLGGTTDFDPGPNTYNLFGNTSFISKLDSAGNFVWAKFIEGPGQDAGYSIAVDDSGYVYSAGFFSGTDDFDPGPESYYMQSVAGNDIYVLKFDSSGSFIWAKSLGGNQNEQAFSLALDSESNVFTTGYFEGTVDFDPGAGTYNIQENGNSDVGDVFVAKLDSSGNFIWAKCMGGSGYDWAYDLVLDERSNVYTTGFFDPTNPDFDPGTGTYFLNPAQPVFISKLDSSGDFVWAKNLGQSGYGYKTSLAIKENYLYINGSFEATADFDPGSGNAQITSQGQHDIFMAKLDTSGNFFWAESFGGIDEDLGQGLVVNETGTLFITGYFYQSADFDPSSAIYEISSAGNNDIFVSAYSETPTNLNEELMNNQSVVFPNPVNKGDFITIDGSQPAEAEICVFNMFGQSIYCNRFRNNKTIIPALWDSGMYLIVVTSGESVKTGKLIIR